MIKKQDIKVSEFVENYNRYATDNLKAKYVGDVLVIKQYVPFMQKVEACLKVVNYSNYDREKQNNVHYDSPLSYLLYVRTIITLYTNFIIESENFLEEYDLLASSGFLYVLMQGVIPEIELKELHTIYQMVRDDFDKNNYEMHGFISKCLDRINNITSTLITPQLSQALGEKIIDFLS